MKYLLIPLLLLSINSFGQAISVNLADTTIGLPERWKTDPVYYTLTKVDTIQAYFTIVDTKTNNVRGVFGYIRREFTLDGHIIFENKILDNWVNTKTIPLNQRKKPFPKTILITFTKVYDETHPYLAW